MGGAGDDGEEHHLHPIPNGYQSLSWRSSSKEVFPPSVETERRQGCLSWPLLNESGPHCVNFFFWFLFHPGTSTLGGFVVFVIWSLARNTIERTCQGRLGSTWDFTFAYWSRQEAMKRLTHARHQRQTHRHVTVTSLFENV